MKNFLILLSLCVYGLPALAQDIVVENPWVREAPPNAEALAGYAIIRNTGKGSVSIVKASSPLFEKVEFHITIFEKGMMKMKHLENLVIPSGGMEEFEPGGRHLMLIKPRKRLRDGDIVPIRLETKDGTVVDVEMKVRR